MDPELKRLVEETHALSKDNHRILRSIRRHQLISSFWKVIVWIVVLALSYYFYQAYLAPLAAKFSASGATAPAGLFGLPTTADLQKLINSYKAGQ